MVREGGPSDSVVRPTGDRTEVAPGAGIMGLRVFLVSISMLFLALIAAYFWVRRLSPAWPPPDAPPLPRGLWVSSIALVGVSVTLQRAVNAVRAGVVEGLMGRLWRTAVWVGLFLVSQSFSWLYFLQADTTFGHHLFGFTFYMLTGLHALHVLGGVVGLGVLMVRTRQGAYNWAHYGGLRYNAIYWHYLLGVWVVLYGILLVDSVV